MGLLVKIKDNLGEIVKYSLALLFIFFLGYSVGVFQHDKSAMIGYKIGIVSFCDLKEVDRFKVCPLLRMSKDMSTGGGVVLYVCSPQTSYLETNSLSKDSAKIIGRALDKARDNGGAVKKMCPTNYGAVYRIIGVKNDKHLI